MRLLPGASWSAVETLESGTGITSADIVFQKKRLTIVYMSVFLCKQIVYKKIQNKGVLVGMTIKTLSEIIDGLSPDDPVGKGSRFLSDPVSVVVSLRIPLEYRILLDVISKRAKKKRSGFASELLMAALHEIKKSESFGIECQKEFQKECMSAGVLLEQFLDEEEQMDLNSRDPARRYNVSHLTEFFPDPLDPDPFFPDETGNKSEDKKNGEGDV